jgi:hypothetical protein
MNDQESPTSLPLEQTGDDTGTPVARRPGSRGLRGLVGGLIGGVVVSAAAAVGLGALWPDIAPLALSDQNRRLDRLERAIDDLNPRLSEVERDLAQSGVTGGDGSQGLNQRIAALEAQNRVPIADPRIGATSDRIERLAADVSRLSTELQSLRAQVPAEGTILRLAERAESAEQQAHDLARRNATAQALLLAVGQLRDAVNRGDPFAPELQAVRRLSGPDEQLDALAPSAGQGIARRETLSAAFPAAADRIIAADTLPDADSLWKKAARKLATLARIRRTDGEGDDTQAIIARGTTLLKGGDLAGAVDQLATLGGDAAKAAQPWLATARARLTADRALSQLTATVAEKSAEANP